MARTASLSNSAQQRYHEHTDISILCVLVMKDSERIQTKGARKCVTNSANAPHTYVVDGMYLL